MQTDCDLNEEISVHIRPPFDYESMAGEIWMADDFDAPLDDFKDYM